MSRRCRDKASEQYSGGRAESRRCRVPAVLTQAAPWQRCRVKALQRPGGSAGSRLCRSPSCVDSGSAESAKRRAQAAAPSQGAAESKRRGRIKSARRPSGDDSRTAESTPCRVQAAAPTRHCRDQAAAQNPREPGQSPSRADSGGFLSELHR